MDTKHSKWPFLPSQQWMYGVIVCLAMVVPNIHSKCPPNPKQRAQKCTEMLGFGFSASRPQEFVAEGAAEKAKHACSNGDLLDVVTCIERVRDECADDTTDDAHYVKSMINSTRARNSIKYFCSNIRVYVANADCLAQNHNLTAQCTQQAALRFRTQVQATDNMDSRMRFSCSLFWTYVNCTERTARSRCNGATADIVKTVLGGFEPPICSTMIYPNIVSGSVEGDMDSSYLGDDNAAVALVSSLVIVLCTLLLSHFV